jgi:hypothetical protein
VNDPWLTSVMQVDDGSEARPASMPIVLNITVSGLTVSETYRLYRYNDETLVPTSAFNTNSTGHAMWAKEFTADAAELALQEEVMSSDKAIYRAVLATAH